MALGFGKILTIYPIYVSQYPMKTVSLTSNRIKLWFTAPIFENRPRPTLVACSLLLLGAGPGLGAHGCYCYCIGCTVLCTLDWVGLYSLGLNLNFKAMTPADLKGVNTLHSLTQIHQHIPVPPQECLGPGRSAAVWQVSIATMAAQLSEPLSASTLIIETSALQSISFWDQSLIFITSSRG